MTYMLQRLKLYSPALAQLKSHKVAEKSFLRISLHEYKLAIVLRINVVLLCRSFLLFKDR